MTQAQLNRAVAEATGESVQQIKRLGFQFLAGPAPRRRRRRGRRARRRRTAHA